MKLTRISVTYGRVQNTGDYSSIKQEATYEATLDAKDDPADAYVVLACLAKEAVVKGIWADRATYSEDWPPQQGRAR